MPIGKIRKKVKKECSQEPAKEAFWRAAITEWQASGLTIRAFVREQKLSEPVFYAWRRELQIKDQETLLEDMPSDSEREKHLHRRVRGCLLSLRQKETAASERKEQFVPVTLVDEAQPAVNFSSRNPNGQIELHLPGGCFIRIFHDTDFVLLGRLMSSLEATKC